MIGSRIIQIYGKIISELNQIFQVPTEHNIKIYNESLYPEWFGLCTYQAKIQNPPLLYNDDIPIQKAMYALDNGGSIFFEGKNYRINERITINSFGILLKGTGVTYSLNPNENKVSTLTCTHLNNVGIFDIKYFGIKFSHLNFIGPSIENTKKGINTKATAINFVRGNQTKDLDAYVLNCSFYAFKYCIYGEGANLRIIDNLFYGSYIIFSVNEAEQDDSLNKAQTRGHIIDRNRFHSMGSYLKSTFLDGATCIKIWSTNGFEYETSNNYEAYTVRGYFNQITNNYADDCKTFFEGTVDRSKINSNSILNSGGTAIKAFTGVHGSISNNIIDGSHTWNPNKLFDNKDSSSISAFPSGHGIHIRYAHFISIHNNQISNKRYHGIYIEFSRNSSIQSNTIMNFNRHRFVKPSGKNPIINDPRNYNAIHIDSTNSQENIDNIVTNKTISIPHLKVDGGHAIYAGDGDDSNFIENNFILSTRILQPSIVII